MLHKTRGFAHAPHHSIITFNGKEIYVKQDFECVHFKKQPDYYKPGLSLADGDQFHHNGMTINRSISREKDGKLWIHVSFSRRSRIPDYDDITRVKRDFIGDDKKAVMVFPALSEHVNIHPYCLHLWNCVDEDPLPDFTQGTGSI